MNEYNEDDYLMISGMQHFVFCRRQWALIHIEQQWEENYRTVDGTVMHKNVHNSSFNETRKDKIIVRAMRVSSRELGLSGECDVVEFTRCSNGIDLFGREGKYSVMPIEYKRGEPKEDDCDAVQLCAQAICLEEMLCCEINEGCIFYGETKRRTKVIFDEALRQRVKAIAKEMHDYYSRQYTPKVRRTTACNACSLKNLCLPVIMKNKSAKSYLKTNLSEEYGEDIE
ncbi:MAG: CRISPR-associated protein Cas4 [Oscillospiraceae bacterium]|nr:CRISPR-associated protein Cas4 [Oscillospiraceae bacterium]